MDKDEFQTTLLIFAVAVLLSAVVFIGHRAEAVTVTATVLQNMCVWPGLVDNENL